MTLPFDHAGIETASLEQDVRLFVEALGLHLIRWGTHSLTGGRIAMLRDDHDVKLELIEVLEPRGDLAHLAFRTADLSTARTQALAAGCLAEGDVRRIDAAKATSAMLRTPSGALVQLICYEPGSPDLATPDGAPG